MVNPEELQEPEITQVTIEEESQEMAADQSLQIVFLGDSILDAYRDGTGIAYLTMFEIFPRLGSHLRFQGLCSHR